MRWPVEITITRREDLPVSSQEVREVEQHQAQMSGSDLTWALNRNRSELPNIVVVAEQLDDLGKPAPAQRTKKTSAKSINFAC